MEVDRKQVKNQNRLGVLIVPKRGMCRTSFHAALQTPGNNKFKLVSYGPQEASEVESYPIGFEQTLL